MNKTVTKIATLLLAFSILLSGCSVGRGELNT